MSLRDDYVAMLERENDELRERIRTLEGALGCRLEVPLALGLTPKEGRLLGVLLSREFVTRETAMVALYGMLADGEEAQPKIIDVFICKIRRKLKPYGIALRIKWGQGYFMTRVAKDAVMAMRSAA